MGIGGEKDSEGAWGYNEAGSFFWGFVEAVIFGRIKFHGWGELVYRCPFDYFPAFKAIVDINILAVGFIFGLLPRHGFDSGDGGIDVSPVYFVFAVCKFLCLCVEPIQNFFPDRMAKKRLICFWSMNMAKHHIFILTHGPPRGNPEYGTPAGEYLWTLYVVGE